MVRVSDIANAPELVGISTIAGAGGLDRGVRTVTVIDAPDTPQWLKGNELLLSSAYMFEHDDSLFMTHVKQMQSVGASGFGIKMGRFIDSIPAEVEAYANEHDFPILKIPYHLVWTDVISTFYKLLYGFQQPYRAIRNDPESVASLVESLKWDPGRFIGRLTDLLHIPAVLVDSHGALRAENEISGVENIMSLYKRRDFFAHGAVSEIYEIEGFYISVQRVPMINCCEPMFLIFAVNAKENVAEMARLFELIERFVTIEAEPARNEEQLYSHFLMRAVSGKITADEVRSFEKNRAAGGNVSSSIILVSGSCYNEVFEHIRESAKDMRTCESAALPPRMLYNQSAGEAVILFEYQSEQPRADMSSLLNGLIAGISDEMLAMGKGCVAASSFHPTLKDILICIKEAEQAREVGLLLWKHQRKYCFSDLSAYIMVRGFGITQIGFSDVELLRTPDALSFDGVETTERYLECNNYKLAAKRLFIHENSLRYRINKINELLKQNLDDPYVSHNMLIKIKLWRLSMEKTYDNRL